MHVKGSLGPESSVSVKTFRKSGTAVFSLRVNYAETFGPVDF